MADFQEKEQELLGTLTSLKGTFEQDKVSLLQFHANEVKETKTKNLRDLKMADDLLKQTVDNHIVEIQKCTWAIQDAQAKAKD